jgi:hypothetical protein
MSQATNGTSSSRILNLAQTIITQTQLLDEHIRTNDLPEPSFKANAPIEPIQRATAEVESARTAVIEAAIELRQLLEGPVKALLPEVYISNINIMKCAKPQLPVKLRTTCSHLPLRHRISRPTIRLNNLCRPRNQMRLTLARSRTYNPVRSNPPPRFPGDQTRIRSAHRRVQNS